MESISALSREFLSGTYSGEEMAGKIKIDEFKLLLNKIQEYVLVDPLFLPSDVEIYLFSLNPVIQKDISIFLREEGYYDWDGEREHPNWGIIGIIRGKHEGIVAFFERQHPRLKPDYYYSLVVDRSRLQEKLDASPNFIVNTITEYNNAVFIELS